MNKKVIYILFLGPLNVAPSAAQNMDSVHVRM